MSTRGPAILVSVGYMDPGNWGTDLQAGARFKYGLLWVVALASLMAIFMQMISARLGVVTGKDLAQCCRDWYPKWTRWPNWLMSEVAIGACDLAEVLGSAVAINLMFHIPLIWAVIITGLDVLLLLGLQQFGMRTIEAIVLPLIATISVCYFIEIFVLPQTQPSFLEMGRALISPHFRESGLLYLAIAIISRLEGYHRRLVLRGTWSMCNGAAMYEKILLTLDGTPTDRAIIEHVKQLAKRAQSRLVLLHVADGWAARTYGPDAVSLRSPKTPRTWREFGLNFIH